MRSRALLLASLTINTALAVSLADFTPRATDLSPTCESVYSSDIPACQASDFESQQCSQDCIQALNALKQSVSKACQGVTGHNILVNIIAGSGTSDLCPNAPKDTGSSSPTTTDTPSSQAPTTTQAPSTITSTTQQQTTNQQQTTQQQTTQSPSPTQTSTTTASSSKGGKTSASTNTVAASSSSFTGDATSTGPGGIAVDTSTPTGVSSPTLATTKPTSTSNADSNGGPFGQGLEPGVKAAAAAGKSRVGGFGVVLAALVVGIVAL